MSKTELGLGKLFSNFFSTLYGVNMDMFSIDFCEKIGGKKILGKTIFLPNLESGSSLDKDFYEDMFT